VRPFLANAALLAALSTLVAAGCSRQPATGAGEPPDRSRETGTPAALKWEGRWDRALARARSEQKVVMVEFYADWCVWCKRMESDTFTDPRVVDLVAVQAVPLRLDADGEGRLLAERFNAQSLPTVVFLSADERELGRIVGFMDAPGFVKRAAGWLQPVSSAES